MIETLLGGLLGGTFRLVPEVLKFFDAKNERKHELALQDKQLEFTKIQGQQKIELAQEQQDLSILDAYKEAVKGQEIRVGTWVDSLTASVRPSITYLFMFLYISVKVSLIAEGGEIWTSDDMAVFAGILNFWFLNRTFEKMGRA